MTNEDKIELRNQLSEAKKQLEDIMNVFNEVTEPKQIDICIFNMISLEIKISYLLSKAKEELNIAIEAYAYES
jgi:hypothetical protein